MKDKQTKPLQAVLHGMDGRTYKTMVMYFQGPCKGEAVVVDEVEGEVDIVDLDFPSGKAALDKIRSQKTRRPVIVLSREEVSFDDVLYVEKPIHLATILSVLAKARALIQQQGWSKSSDIQPVKTTENPVAVAEKKVHGDGIEIKKTAKHKTAMQMDEGSFSAFIGMITEIDFNDKDQLDKAFYSPKNYFQGYVTAAVKVSKEKNRMLQLNSNWKPLLIFPHSHEVWLDADDKQLRAFASLEMNKATGAKLTITAIDPATSAVREKMDKFYDIDAFVWKLAIWTSKGRYPQSLDIHRPVFIKHWPNFTRSLITPHALQITALLMRGPRSMLNITETLKIKPQYVFVFISAAHALGLVGQAERKSDELFVPPPLDTIAKKESKSLLSRILGKLRSSK